MNEDVSSRARRAFRDHGSFERTGERTYEAVTTPFDGTVRVEVVEGGHLRFRVRVVVPTLSAAVDGDVASVVEEGWYETFVLRIEDVGGLTHADHDLNPTAHREGGEVVVEVEFEDRNERRGVDAAAAIVNYVEGTYVQGIIPGYDYADPVSELLARAQDTGTGGPMP